MHFISWLEESDFEITKIIIRDYNNGCLPPVRNISQLRQHFIDKHPVRASAIIEQLEVARKAYKDSIND